MIEKSRTEYSFRNTTAAMISRIVAILMGFLTRVVFTHTLSESYVGINGLFSDILNVLSLTELGVGTAITYALYKPIAEKDITLQKSLMKLYRNFYYIIAGIVLVAGLAVIPFMDILIKNQPEVDYLIFIYLMYLANSVLSYLLIYKRTLIDAHQLSYIGVVCQTVFLVIQDIVQIVLLVTTKNFILFLVVYLVCTLGNNLWISRKADKLYPFLKEKNVEPLPAEQKKDIIKNIKAMLMHKVGNVVINNTDNLLLSSMVGIISVGCYSNYYLVIGSVRQVLNQMFQGIMASVGNLGVTQDSGHVKKIFETSFFVGQWMYGFAAVCLYELVSIFVELSFGAQYVFPQIVVLILCMNFYITGMRQAVLIFRDSLGLFWYDRYKSVVEAILNLILSIILAYQFGTAGVFLGTMLSALASSVWVEPWMLYRHSLKSPVKEYFKKYVLYVAVMGLIWALTHWICSFFTGSLVFLLFCRLGLCTIVPNAILLLCYWRTKEFQLLKSKLLNLGKKKRHAETTFSEKDEQLLYVLRQALQETPVDKRFEKLPENTDWPEMCERAKRHAVLSFLYELSESGRLQDNECKKVVSAARQTVQQSYRLLFLSKYLISLLEKDSIPVILLKGVATAEYYPVPELRKSGDIDLLLCYPENIDRAENVLVNAGFAIKEKQSANHHVVFETAEGIEVELHVMLAEPFDNQRTNQYMKQLQEGIPKQVLQKEIMGVRLPILADGYHAFELLLHMLQHYLRSGFGLKLLCDWVVFWNREVSGEQIAIYQRLTKESGLTGFSDMITSLCTYYLGLKEENVNFCNLMDKESCQEFMLEILEAEEFGKSSTERMVTLRGGTITDYLREFHHQMQLNFPNAGRKWLCWPILWIVTLIRFLHNNRKIRKTSTWKIMRKTGQRSRKMKKIKLFDND